MVSSDVENSPVRPQPPTESLQVARAIQSRLGKRSHAPVRAAFVGANDSVHPEGVDPPLARILRGGRGGEVRLKLELSFLWFAANPPHDLIYPARVWAQLLGLSDPENAGTRRVRQAINSLAEFGLVEVKTTPGHPSRITLLDEGSPGQKYTLPGKTYNSVRNTEEKWRHRYFQVPNAFWTQGWIAVLSGAAVAMLLVLLSELGQREAQVTDLWFSPDRAKRVLGLSEDTRSKGLRELQSVGLVTSRRKSASRDVLDFRRVRNTYRVDLEKMNAGL